MALALPACLVVFDLIARKGTDFRDRPYAKRRRKLEKLLDRPLPAHLALMPMTTSTAVARLWMADHAAVGVEGVVAKRLDCPYRSGRRGGWQKIRTRTTAEAVVGGVLGPRERPDVLNVGCRDAQGRLRMCGRTTTLSAAAKTSLADILEPAGPAHPWPATIPASRLGALPGSTIAYTRVKPRVVVELEVDTALENMRWRHPCRYRRVRRDLKPADLRAGPSPRD
jgi:ATP-dependent DNA ligase